MNRRTLAIIAGLGASTVLGLALAINLLGPERHIDGAGPLGSLGQPVHDAMRVDPAGGGTSWTFGVPLCLASGRTPAIIESVSPTKSVGTGFRLLGTGVRQFLVTQTDIPMVSVEGWPPPRDKVPDAIHALRGFAVSTPCVTTTPGSGEYTELLIGFGRVGTKGGGWQGVEIEYTVAGSHRILDVTHDIGICGTSFSCAVPSEPAG